MRTKQEKGGFLCSCAAIAVVKLRAIASHPRWLLHERHADARLARCGKVEIRFQAHQVMAGSYARKGRIQSSSSISGQSWAAQNRLGGHHIATASRRVIWVRISASGSHVASEHPRVRSRVLVLRRQHQQRLVATSLKIAYDEDRNATYRDKAGRPPRIGCSASRVVTPAISRPGRQ